MRPRVERQALGAGDCQQWPEVKEAKKIFPGIVTLNDLDFYLPKVQEDQLFFL